MVNEFAGIGNEANEGNNTAFLSGINENLEVLMQFPDATISMNKVMSQLSKSSTLTTTRSAEDPEQAAMEEEKKEAQPANHRQVRQVSDMNAGKGAASQSNNGAASGTQPIIKNNRIATFLGINIEADQSYVHNLKTLFTTGFKQAGEPQQMINDFKSMCQQREAFSPWKFPASHHVTTLFIGGNKNKMKQPQAQFHQEGKEVAVEIRALIYVPDKLVAGICFPEAEIENEFPHLTLMVSQGWAPVMSNAVIKATCGRGGEFEQAYIAAEDGKRPAAGAGVHTA